MKKVNYKAVEAFSERLSEKLLFDNYHNRDVLTGKDIMNLSPVKQLNLFVLKEIFSSWKTEVSRLESPYFDYQSEEVQQALQSFMDVLSFQIKVKKSDLSPLVKKAIKDMLKWVCEPLVYLEQNLGGENVSEIKKYFLVHAALLEQFTGSVDELKLKLDKGEIALDNDFDFIEKLNEVFPVEPEDFIMNEVDGYTPVPNTGFNHAIEEEQEEPELDVEENAVEAEEVEEPVEDEQVEQEEVQTISVVKETKSPTLLDRLQKSKEGSIKDRIGINLKFSFQKELFGNNVEAYETAMNELDRYTDYETASSYLIRNFASQYDWENKEEVAAELFDLMAKRYD